MSGAIAEAYKKVLCKRATSADASCIAQRAETILLAAQAGGVLANFIFLRYKGLPSKSSVTDSVLVDAMNQVETFTDDLYFGQPRQQVVDVADAATWIAWFHTTQGEDPEDHMEFTAQMLKAEQDPKNNSTTGTDGECKDGPAPEDTPFCGNCGGNRLGKQKESSGDATGVCNGVSTLILNLGLRS